MAEVKTIQFADGVTISGGVSAQTVYYEDATGWDGSTNEVSYDVGTLAGVTNAYALIWELHSATGENMGGAITHTSATNVTVTFELDLADATYYLVGR
jgi:hypothetical protein